MAIIFTLIVPEPRIIPFTLVEEKETNLPRGQLVFRVDEAAITLSGVGDSQSVEVRCACPENFAYALLEAHIEIHGAAGLAANWDADMRGNVQSRNGDIKIAMHSEGVWTGISGAGGPEGRIWEPIRGTPMIIVPTPGESNTVSFKVSNTTLNEATVDLDALIRFVIYDVAQIHQVEVNTPQLIR